MHFFQARLIEKTLIMLQALILLASLVSLSLASPDIPDLNSSDQPSEISNHSEKPEKDGTQELSDTPTEVTPTWKI